MRNLVLVAVLCLPAIAQADDYASRGVRLDVTAYLGTDIVVAIKAPPEGGQVNIPIGAVFTAEGNSFQDVVLGERLRMDLEPGERVEVTLAAYCMNRDRESAPYGTSMTYSRMAPPQVTALLERASEPHSDLSPEQRRQIRRLHRLRRSDVTQQHVWEALGQIAKTQP